MKNHIAAVLAGLAGLVAGCTSTPMTPEETPSVISHFYPLKNGAKYTYSRFVSDPRTSTVDTVTYQIAVGTKRDEPSRLVRAEEKLSSPRTLYNFAYSNDGGVESAVLWDSTFHHVVLKGSLQVGSSWIADTATNTEAHVVDHFAEYYLPGVSESFQDVIAVRYQRAGDPQTTYLLRFFARDKGLIHERYFVGNNGTEIGNLQLLKFQPFTTTSVAVLPSNGLQYYYRDATGLRYRFDADDELKK